MQGLRPPRVITIGGSRLLRCANGPVEIPARNVIGAATGEPGLGWERAVGARALVAKDAQGPVFAVSRKHLYLRPKLYWTREVLKEEIQWHLEKPARALKYHCWLRREVYSSAGRKFQATASRIVKMSRREAQKRGEGPRWRECSEWLSPRVSRLRVKSREERLYQRRSLGERRIRQLLIESGLRHTEQYRIPGTRFSFDFVVDGVVSKGGYRRPRRLVIEVDGEHHFQQVRNWPPPQDVVRRDVAKARWAIAQGWKILRVPGGQTPLGAETLIKGARSRSKVSFVVGDQILPSGEHGPWAVFAKRLGLAKS